MNIKLLLVILCFLNGCARVLTPQGSTIYEVKVQPGDTLQAIAHYFKVSVSEIASLNKIENPNILRVGQLIRVKTSRKLKTDQPISWSLQPASQNVPSITTDTETSLPAEVRSKGFFFKENKIPFPVKGVITSHFGMRRGRFHQGIDIGAKTGSRIRAVASGKVTYAGWQKGYGRVVKIAHDGFKTVYAHMSKIKIKKGRRVKTGDIIGLVGSSGNASAPHLHFEYHRNNRPLNPIAWFNKNQARTSRQ